LGHQDDAKMPDGLVTPRTPVPVTGSLSARSAREPAASSEWARCDARSLRASFWVVPLTLRDM